MRKLRHLLILASLLCQTTKYGPLAFQHLAFEDAVLLARVTAATFDPCEETLLRYFRPLEAAFVKQVFQTIANIPLSQELDGDNVVGILSSASVAQDLQPKFDQLEIAYGNHPTLPENKQDCGKAAAKGEGGITAAFAFIDPRVLGDIALVSMCDEAFEYPTLEEIANPSSSARDPQGNPEPGYTCDGLGDHDSDWMTSPGGVLLHELLHWTFLLEDIPGFEDIIDENEDNFPQIIDFWGPNPPDGYGPFRASQLRDLGAYVAIQNADTYRCYAQSKYWAWKCGKPFEPAQSEDDNIRKTGVRIIQGDPKTGED
ncbi:uncharacterized protein Z519_09931 [Cladophialophora bantiana CBS 173.52]|uniref:Lysine-specific metallo-endopeptidase domain-containing protein n=1 Tax=Cladophialophora bantiana (strain ATCC 10958 / CBS 173.52 / CDC B-1940 / NIH 8579) TaxID=1442370 RepID=A0A0D2HYU0_CLAB1|nr:uncharacterized protein Z519_09931 [Cladophialophora bantiana CBS 173.52]KIW89774.1 hypothetical protein Z519_09931 [Cladophialophora bantiana CBS 173.52]